MMKPKECLNFKWCSYARPKCWVAVNHTIVQQLGLGLKFTFNKTYGVYYPIPLGFSTGSRKGYLIYFDLIDNYSNFPDTIIS